MSWNRDCQLSDKRGNSCQVAGFGVASRACLWTHCVLSLQINRMDYVEINVDHKFHRHLIGKSGANSE